MSKGDVVGPLGVCMCFCIYMCVCVCVHSAVSQPEHILSYFLLHMVELMRRERSTDEDSKSVFLSLFQCFSLFVCFN